MSFSDPQSTTISGTAISLPRVTTGAGTSTYQSADGLVSLTASSSYGKRNRRVLRLDHAKIAADLYTAENAKFTMSNYIVFDTPSYGYSAAEVLAVWAGFKGTVTATSDLLVTKLLGGES
ncbi:TPA_asm: coat protein [ssRNA phage Gephyllon.4_19]|uniref:Coat protein n=2 Tax=Leviviricetes TaxID=2842243 RepID=A0A8S5KYU0_9VIRU|nr:coat protein [ssRNA phage Gephyllon.4_19]QDH87434.1 MAG: hypothetical protein H4BulkLitter24352_000002 [Leviviridae sp.]DAD50034.1 TPA_asm: coat protein [ssRNA phage Gephyllon.4_19]